MGALERALAEQDAIVGEDADGKSVDVGKAADERLAVERLELMKFRAVDDARDHLANVVRSARVGGHDAVEIFRGEQRILRLAEFQNRMLQPVEVGDDAPRDARGRGWLRSLV